MKYGAPKEVKLYYTISEVSDLTAVPAHILRYWEQEFAVLRPRKNRAGNRTYREKDIELIRKIQNLLQVEKFTIDGALRRLQDAGIQTVEDDEPLPEDVGSNSLEAPEIDETKPTIKMDAAKSSAILQSLKEIRDLLR